MIAKHPVAYNNPTTVYLLEQLEPRFCLPLQIYNYSVKRVVDAKQIIFPCKFISRKSTTQQNREMPGVP